MVDTQSAQQAPGLDREIRIVRTLDDRGEGSIVIQQQDESMPGGRCPDSLRKRSCGNELRHLYLVVQVIFSLRLCAKRPKLYTGLSFGLLKIASQNFLLPPGGGSRCARYRWKGYNGISRLMAGQVIYGSAGRLLPGRRGIFYRNNGSEEHYGRDAV